MTSLRVTRSDRLKSAIPSLVSLSLGVLVSLTPIGWILPAKQWVYEALAYSPTFAPISSASEIRPRALAAWDWLHPKTIIIAAFVFTVGLPLIPWLVLDLEELWTGDARTLDDKVQAVQLTVALLLGAVAIQAFLLFQLPSLRPPAVSVRALLPSNDISDGLEYSARPSQYIEMASGSATWVHIRVTNVGVRSYDGISVGIVMPDGFRIGRLRRVPASGHLHALCWTPERGGMVQRSSEDNLLPDGARPYQFRDRYLTVEFDANRNPRETGPGDSGLYSFHIGAPDAPGAFTMKVVVRATGSTGATEQKIAVTVSDREQA